LARHPSFHAEVATRAVRELHWVDLLDVWEATGRLLASCDHPRQRLNWVRLRAAVLDELESRNARKFDRWYRHQWQSPVS
jgi:hypothetical protein